MKIYIDSSYKIIYEDKGDCRVFFGKYIDKKDLINILKDLKSRFNVRSSCSYSTIQNRFNSL